jgi:CRP-like cAMP-binding protein
LPPRNRLLAQLSPNELARIQPYLEPVPLPKGKVLYDYGDTPTYAYFPASGMLSMLAATESGAALEVAIVCADGFVGIPILFQASASAQVRVQLAGDASRLRADVLLKEFRTGGALQRTLLQYANRVLAQTTQAAICHRYHSVTERLCRWFLLVHDCLGADTIELTQECIAHTLGIPRSAVSTTAASLQDHGFIRQRHGRIQVLNRRGLQQWTCECYAMLADGGDRPSLALPHPSDRSRRSTASPDVSRRAPPGAPSDRG